MLAKTVEKLQTERERAGQLRIVADKRIVVEECAAELTAYLRDLDAGKQHLWSGHVFKELPSLDAEPAVLATQDAAAQGPGQLGQV